MKKIYFYFIMFFLLISFVSAQEQSLGTFQKDKCIKLIQVCQNCTYNNITSVNFPNSTIAVANQSMTKIDTEYTFLFCNTSVTGTYLVYGFGDLNGVKTTWGYDFKVTPTGEELSLAVSFIFIGLSVFLLFLFGLCIYWIIISENLLSKYAFISLAYILLIGLSFLGWRMAESFITSLPFLSSFLHLVWLILMWSLFPFIILLFILYIKSLKEIKQIEKLINKGYDFESAKKRVRRKK